MKVIFDESALVPVIEKTVLETLNQVDADRSRLGDRLAFPEAEAARSLGVKPHILRDARLRGDISGTRIGRRVVYEREQLLEWLRRNRGK